jgi:Dolichyl-phosphate-mannose-protein mannosyltransferase
LNFQSPKFKKVSPENNPNLFPVERVAGEATRGLAPSEGLFLKWLVTGGLFVIPLLIYILYYKAMFSGLTNSDALDHAQLGRNLSEGRGFTTYFLRPLGLTHGDNLLRQADLTHGPVFPTLLAIAFTAKGATDAVASYVSGVFYLLTVPMIYWFGNRVFSRIVGLVAAVIFATNPLMLEYSISGLPITLATFMMTSLLMAIYSLATYSRDQEANPTSSPLPRVPLILSGLLVGGLYLTDPIFVYTVPVVIVAVFSLMQKQRAKAMLQFGLPLAIITLPWMARNAALTGNPLFGLRGMELWMGTPNYYPGGIAYRTMPADLNPSTGLFQAIIRKIFLGTGELVQTFPQMSGSWILAFLLPSLLFRFRNTAAMSVRRVMTYCLLAVAVGMLPFGVEMPLFGMLIPAMLVFSVAYLVHVSDQAKLPRSSIILLASLISAAVILPLARNMMTHTKQATLPEVISASALGKVTSKDDIVLSDQPWIVAWHANRPAIWIPAVDSNIKSYRKRFPNMRWLFLTSQVTTYSPEWNQIYNVFAQWNARYIQAGLFKPDAITVGGTQFSLLEGLSGFTSMEPAPGSSPAVVVAGIPQQGSPTK